MARKAYQKDMAWAITKRASNVCLFACLRREGMLNRGDGAIGMGCMAWTIIVSGTAS